MRHKLKRAAALYRRRGLPAVGNALLKMCDRVLRSPRAHSQPHFLIIEPTTRCNLACQFCPRTAEGVTGGRDMSLPDFLRVLDAFPLLENIVVQGVGEPLLHPGLLDMIRAARARGINTEFNTNGTLLQEKRCAEIVAGGVELVSVSVDAVEPQQFAVLRTGATLDQVAAGLRRLVAARVAAGSATPQLMLRTAVGRHNLAALPEIIAWGEALGVTMFALQDFLACTPEAAAAAITRAEYTSLLAQVESLRRPGRTILFANFNRFLPRHSRSHCSDPWDQPFISVDGSVVPCCTIYDPRKMAFGNILRQPFREIWNSPAYRSFRRGFDRACPDVCRGCPKY